MRLIDADEMLELLTAAYIRSYPKCDVLTAKVNTVVHKKITELIKSTPTAYDPDKVVEALEKEVPKILGHEYGSSYKALKIIEIVKKGGVE